MSDDRTKEQRDADEELTKAIIRAANAYEMAHDSTITGYVVCGTAIRFDDKGPINVDFSLIQDNGEQVNDIQLLGMLRAATLRAEHDYMQGDDF
jgi:hypothetical protein